MIDKVVKWSLVQCTKHRKIEQCTEQTVIGVALVLARIAPDDIFGSYFEFDVAACVAAHDKLAIDT